MKLLLLQWHITEKCNLNCSHCYRQEHLEKEVGFHELRLVLEQFKDFLNYYRIRGHITVAGGEPFVRQDFPELLEIFAGHAKRFSFAILTNGTLLDAAVCRQLRKWKVSFVQVSVEGTQETHDTIRGKGNFEQVCAAVRHLVAAKIRTLISFTAHQENFREFAQVAEIGRRLKVSRVWADRLIPIGNGAGLKTLSPEQTQEFFEIMGRSVKKSWFNKTEIAMHRALQFLIGQDRPYSCTAGNTLINVMPNCDLYPCRRMPVKVGNLLETPLHELYDCSFFKSLRENCIAEGCENCIYKNVCKGGLRCLSYALTGNPFRADPGCWLANLT